jgi:O-antigen ligase
LLCWRACDDTVTGLIQRLWSSLVGFVTGSYITRDQCDDAFERMHARDRIGDRVHLVFACIAMLGLAGPVSAVDIAVLPMVVFFLVRVFNTFPLWIHGFGQPVVLVALMLAAWMGLSLLWSPDPIAGLEHISELRWLVFLGFAFPVIEHRKVLIACLCIGFLVGNAVQVVDAFDGFGNAWLAERLDHYPNRISGWWEPAVGGSVLVAALGLHLPAAIMGSGKGRILGLLGSLVTVVAVLATGTRGAWIAGAILIVCAVVIAWKIHRLKARTLIFGGGVLVIAVVAMMLIKGDAITERLSNAREEITLAMDGEHNTSTGARISMGTQAIKIGAEHPIGGIGAGGFRSWMQEHTEKRVDDQAHAHCSALRLFSEQGIPGVLLGMLLAAVILTNAWRSVPSDQRGTYVMGPFFGVLGLVLISAFDSILLNVNTAAILGALAMLSPAYLPGMGESRDDRGGADVSS